MKSEDFNKIEKMGDQTVYHGGYTPEKAMRYRTMGFLFTVYPDRLEAFLEKSKIILKA